MKSPTDEQVAAWLVGIIADGFNRSLGALEDAGAINTRKMRKHYKGMGSKYYDLVTKAIYKTAGWSAPSFRNLLGDDSGGAAGPEKDK